MEPNLQFDIDSERQIFELGNFIYSQEFLSKAIYLLITIQLQIIF